MMYLLLPVCNILLFYGVWRGKLLCFLPWLLLHAALFFEAVIALVFCIVNSIRTSVIEPRHQEGGHLEMKTSFFWPDGKDSSSADFETREEEQLPPGLSPAGRKESMTRLSSRDDPNTSESMSSYYCDKLSEY